MAALIAPQRCSAEQAIGVLVNAADDTADDLMGSFVGSSISSDNNGSTAQREPAQAGALTDQQALRRAI